ncbi:MAG: galactokinase family protein [Phycisphaerae bacterium]
MAGRGNLVCVILAGGQGTRMASPRQHKVCFPILGRPAIVRAIETYKRAGLGRFLVVVGQMAGQVIATVAEAHPDVTFVYQAEPLGTGHAALVAAEALAAQGYTGGVLLTMGDKVTRPGVVRDLVARYRAADAEVVMATLPKRGGTTAGRVVTDGRGRVLGIVERADIASARRRRTRLHVGGRSLTAAQVERAARAVNPSMYVFRFGPLLAALRRLQTDNVQGELYLTDTIEPLAAGRVETMPVADPDDLMAFNTPAELMAVEEVVRKRERPPRVRAAKRRRLSARVLKPAGEWLDHLTAGSPGLARFLRRTYGPDESLAAERIRAMAGVVRAFVRRFDRDRPVVLCRAPGRVNLMGRHVDHRGGYVNVMAISREVLLAASPRDDDTVRLEHVEPKRFASRRFRIRDLLRRASWAEWIDFVDSQTVRGLLDETQGDWSHYARAAFLRLQHECRQVRLRGMDAVVAGNIPMGAGLSSSSALVVAFAEAAVQLNGLNVALGDFVDLCGEGEWFVGSRGGSADHAAIRTSRIGHLSRIGFFPLRMEGEVRFPPDLRVVIAHSGSQAVKSAGARHVFNQRVACYEVAEMLLRHEWSAAAGMEHLRDLVPERLGVRTGEVYRALARLPSRPSRRDLRRLLPADDHDRLEPLFASHRSLGPYDLRGVALYGLAEIVRSDRFAGVLAGGDLDAVGRMLRTSHDGDRRFRFDAAGRRRRFLVRTDDRTLARLADADAPLAEQCGRYGCSTEAIDDLVDLAAGTDGVVGAQLAGAGLGGCMMILVRSGALERLMRRLRRDFYQPRTIPFGAYVCSPVAGAGLVRA